MMMKKNFYNKKYKNNKFYWGKKPNFLIIQLKNILPPGSTILDLGSGEGQNTIYLAKHGFQVTAIDLSKIGIEKTKQWAKKENLKIETKINNVINIIKSSKKFDAIIAINIIQFIPHDKIPYFIKRIKTKTKPNGFNIINTFINHKNNQKYFFNKNDLTKYYSDWKIIKYQEKLGKWETHGEKLHRHYLVKLIAQKKSTRP